MLRLSMGSYRCALVSRGADEKLICTKNAGVAGQGICFFLKEAWFLPRLSKTRIQVRFGKAMCDGITAEALAQRRREDETGGSVRENAGDLGERELLRIPTAQADTDTTRCQSTLCPFCQGRGRGGQAG